MLATCIHSSSENSQHLLLAQAEKVSAEEAAAVLQQQLQATVQQAQQASADAAAQLQSLSDTSVAESQQLVVGHSSFLETSLHIHVPDAVAASLAGCG